jgi:hypothetical protein
VMLSRRIPLCSLWTCRFKQGFGLSQAVISVWTSLMAYRHERREKLC